MAILWGVLTISVSISAVAGSFKMLATENACFSATEFLTEYDFHAPADGEVVGVELEHVSGGITCATSLAQAHWGCRNNWFMLNFLEYGDDGSDSAIFPSSTMEGMTNFGQYGSCPNGHGCSGNFQMSAYSVDSATLVMQDEANPFAVTTADTFSFQVSEGCCGTSTSDNSGVSCAKVYFLYSTDPTHCSSTGCDDQFICNTDTGECEQIDCTTAGCDDQLVCNTETGECERDCDILHIDDFLLDCSAEWDSNTASNTAMASSITTNTANIATVNASAATNADDIATVNGSVNTNSAGLTAMGTRLESVESRLSAIELTLSRMAILSAHSSIGDMDVSTAADLEDDGSWTAMTLNGKDVVIVGMLAVNAVLITSMAVVCCRKQRGQQKYQAVTIASD